MNKENIPVITDREKIYDKCKNMEQLFDNYYLPLLDKHYSKTYELQQENQQLKESYCNRTDCSGRLHDSRKYPSVKQQLDLYKSVLDEIREYIENNNLINILNRNDLLQILDKVGKE